MVVGMLGKSALKTTVLLTLSGLTIQMPSGYSNFTGFSNLVQSYSAGREASCIGGVVQTPVAANNTKILLSAPTTNAAVTEFYVELTQANSKIAATSVGGVNLVSGTYGIYTEVCFPANPVAAEKVATLQVLTHGGTLDHTYWDIAPGYSYVDAAVAAGYATLSYDRLGTGRSDHPDPVQIVQLPIQIEIVHALVQKARRGEIGGRSFDKVVGVGHSLGSGVTQGVAAKYIEDFNALILQGTSTNFNYALTGVASEDQHIASTDPSGRFRGLANGYHTPANTQFALQFAFYRYPNYDPNSKITLPLPLNTPLLRPLTLKSLQPSNLQQTNQRPGRDFHTRYRLCSSYPLPGPRRHRQWRKRLLLLRWRLQLPNRPGRSSHPSVFPFRQQNWIAEFLGAKCGS